MQFHVGQLVTTWDGDIRVMGRIDGIAGQVCKIELGDGTHVYRLMSVLSLAE